MNVLDEDRRVIKRIWNFQRKGITCDGLVTSHEILYFDLFSVEETEVGGDVMWTANFHPSKSLACTDENSTTIPFDDLICMEDHGECEEDDLTWIFKTAIRK